MAAGHRPCACLVQGARGIIVAEGDASSCWKVVPGVGASGSDLSFS